MKFSSERGRGGEAAPGDANQGDIANARERHDKLVTVPGFPVEG
jgi:hypothetical protein